MSWISPDTAEKFARFRTNRRAYWSLLLLLALFLLSLPAELLFNDKPLVLAVDGRLYFPVLRTYTWRDFGGSSDIPVYSYRSEAFRMILEGRVSKVDPVKVFGDDNEDAAIDAMPAAETSSHAVPVVGEVPAPATERRHWQVDPLFRHSHKSYFISTRLRRQNLANPIDHADPEGNVETGAAVEGFYLGTDREGKCVMARIVYGFRLCMLFGVCLAISSTLVGCLLGAIQGYFGGWVDLLGQRLTELWGSIPRLFLLMILSSFLARREDMGDFQRYAVLFVILNLFDWMGMAAQMRAMFLRARNLEYVKAARALGVSNYRIMMTHILPNSLVPIVTSVPFVVASGILSLSALDFLHLGVMYPAPSLGELLSQGQEFLFAWWILLPTFTVLVVLMVLLNYVGEGVRNAFDPRHRERADAA